MGVDDILIIKDMSKRNLDSVLVTSFLRTIQLI